jgi:hypothetical protein
MLDNTVVITTERTARILGEYLTTRVTQHADTHSIEIHQEGDDDSVFLSPDDAEALFLVLDTMLHPDDAGVDPDFDEVTGDDLYGEWTLDDFYEYDLSN